MNYLITGVVCICVIILPILYIFGLFKDRRERYNAIREKFTNYAGGWRFVKGSSIYDYLYINNTIYKIVFSQSHPIQIVYINEMNNDYEIVEQEKLSIKKKINQSRRSKY